MVGNMADHSARYREYGYHPGGAYKLQEVYEEAASLDFDLWSHIKIGFWYYVQAVSVLTCIYFTYCFVTWSQGVVRRILTLRQVEHRSWIDSISSGFDQTAFAINTRSHGPGRTGRQLPPPRTAHRSRSGHSRYQEESEMKTYMSSRRRRNRSEQSTLISRRVSSPPLTRHLSVPRRIPLSSTPSRRHSLSRPLEHRSLLRRLQHYLREQAREGQESFRGTLRRLTSTRPGRREQSEVHEEQVALQPLPPLPQVPLEPGNQTAE